jgi:hypothetical protein
MSISNKKFKVVSNNIKIFSENNFDLNKLTLKGISECTIILFYSDNYDDIDSKRLVVDFNESSSKISNVNFGIINIFESPILSEKLKDKFKINYAPFILVYKNENPHIFDGDDLDEYALMVACQC